MENRPSPKDRLGVWDVLLAMSPTSRVILSILVVLVYALINGGFNFLERRDAKNAQIANAVIEKQKELEKYKDSVKRRTDSLKHMRTFRNIGKIYDIMKESKSDFPTATSTSVYLLHDSGGVPTPGSPLNCTILYQETNQGYVSSKKDWQGDVLTKGFFHFNKFVYDNGHKYIDDVASYQLIYEPETIVYLELYNIRAMYGLFLDQGSIGTYYLSIGFPMTQPFEDDPSIRYKATRLGTKLRPLLQVR